MKSSLQRAKEFIKALPPVNAYLKHAYKKHFLTARRCNLFFGVYPDMQTASLQAPSGTHLGYDNQDAANMYDERTERVYSTDYSVLFWLSQLSSSTNKIFEIGGHIGVSFYAYQKILPSIEDMQWRILDVPAVTERGKKIAAAKGETRLTFTTRYEDSDTADLLLAIGSLQYIDTPLSDLIGSMAGVPDHIILNMLPVNNIETYYTVQNIGTAYCPYKIINREELINDLATLGYRLVDEWINPEKHCWIGYSDNRYSLDHYCGFYFSRV
ncbi:MAG: methyltransferase, TIGR04325 family [Candidatus Thiodiazotropha sp.]